MTQRLQILVFSGLFALAACHRDSVRRGADKTFETVEEGQAAGVTSTIHGPGETPPPMTGTNVDTTSAFALDPALTTGPATPPGTLAGTLPTQPYGGMGGPGYRPPPFTAAPTPAQPTTQPAPVQQPPARDVPTDTATTALPPTTTSEAPPTETAEPAPPPTQTDTVPAPSEKPKPADEKPPEQTDTQKSEPPPPPPPI
jgi:hypothetical protein